MWQTCTHNITLRLNLLGGGTDVLSNWDLSRIFSSAPRGERMKKKKELRQSRESPPDCSPSHTTGHLKHTVNRNMYYRMFLVTRSVSEVYYNQPLESHPSLPPPPLFLLYRERHAVSCLLMDSHRSVTCNSHLTEWCSTEAIEPTYCGDSLWKLSRCCSLFSELKSSPFELRQLCVFCSFWSK